MMRFLQYISSLVLALYFLLAGDGFNVVDYCCDTCRNAGIEYISHHSCFAVHENQHDACCSHESMMINGEKIFNHHHADKCSLYHFGVETPTITSIVFRYLHADFYLFTPITTALSLIPITEESNQTFLNNPPPDLSETGRFILSRKSVLII